MGWLVQLTLIESISVLIQPSRHVIHYIASVMFDSKAVDGVWGWGRTPVVGGERLRGGEEGWMAIGVLFGEFA